MPTFPNELPDNTNGKELTEYAATLFNQINERTDNNDEHQIKGNDNSERAC